MGANANFEIITDPTRNLARVRYLGHVTADNVAECAKAIERLLPAMRPGFTVLTDLSALESMELDCVPHLTRIMDLSKAHGIGTVVRVVPDRAKDIGFNILSIIHYRRGVKIVTCETIAEADRALAK